MVNKKIRSLGAALCGVAGLSAITLSAPGALALSRLCDPVSWGTGSQCFGGDSSLFVAGSGRGDGSGSSAKLGVSIDVGGYQARAYSYDVYGNFLSSCQATDTTVNGDSSYDLTGCGTASTYRIRVYW